MDEVHTIDGDLLGCCFAELMQGRFEVSDFSHLMKDGKIMDEQTKLRVRAYLYSSNNDSERMQRQVEVADFFGLKAQQVSSLFAWIKYGNRKLNHQETKDQKTEILELMADVHDAFERALLVFEIRELYQLTTDCIEEILQGAVSEEVEDSQVVVQNDEADLVQNASVPVIDDETDFILEPTPEPKSKVIETTAVVGPSSEAEKGDMVSYDNELKQKWRQQILDDIVGFTTETQRRTMKVLTLPGRKCLEIPGLLSIGIKAENIVGVEGGSQEAREEFMRNATRYGIQTRLGRLKDIVPEEKTRFGAVLLDFHGQWSPSKEHTIRHLLLDEFAVVMINLMAKREGIDIQSGMREIDAQVRYYQKNPAMLNQTTSIDLNDLDPNLGEDELADVFFGTSHRDLIDEARVVRDLRNAGFSDLLNSFLSLDREENWIYPSLFERLPGLDFLGIIEPHRETKSPGRILQHKQLFGMECFEGFFKRLFGSLTFHARVIERLEAQLERISGQIFGTIGVDIARAGLRKELSQRHQGILTSLVSSLEYMYKRLTMALPRITALEKYSYESQSGTGTCTFYTDIVAVECPYKVAQACRQTMRFLLKGMDSALVEHFTRADYSVVMRDKFGQMPHQYASGNPKLAPPSLASLDVFRTKKQSRQRDSVKASRTLLLKDGYGRDVHDMKVSTLLKDIDRFYDYLDIVGRDHGVQERRRTDPRIVIE